VEQMPPVFGLDQALKDKATAIFACSQRQRIHPKIAEHQPPIPQSETN
jgi:hypothetical protein